MPGGQSVLDHLARPLYGEVDDGRRTTPGRGPGPGVERVTRRGAAERKLHMRVRVDPARDHILAGGIDHLVRRQRLAERRVHYRDDLLALDQHVRDLRPGRPDDGSTLDQQHIRSPL
jgi:hypothetical protein